MLSRLLESAIQPLFDIFDSITGYKPPSEVSSKNNTPAGIKQTSTTSGTKAMFHQLRIATNYPGIIGTESLGAATTETIFTASENGIFSAPYLSPEHARSAQASLFHATHLALSPTNGEEGNLSDVVQQLMQPK